MRTESKLAALSLLLLGACSRRQEQTAGLTDDLKKDLAAVSAPDGGLATAQRSYQRMRFVSDIEQSKAGVPAKRPAMAHHHATTSHHATKAPTTDVASQSVMSMESPAPAPVSTPSAAAPEPSVVIAQHPAPEPASAPAASPSDEGIGDRGRSGGGGLGGLLGGILAGVVIRGGHGGIDHCDPRTDGRARPTVIDRPDFGLPVPTGQVFGGGGSRRR
jgi:hypothetical protein